MVTLGKLGKGDGKGLIYIVFIAVSFILIGISDNSRVDKPRNYGLSFLAFFQNIINGTSSFIGDTFNSIAELKEMKKNYEDALGLLENYAGLERELESLRIENALLKEQIDFSQELTFSNVSAKIIGKDPENFYSSFIVNRGSSDGIAKNMAVVAYNKGLFGLVGKVEEVGVNSSIIIPITNSQCFVAARLQNSRIEGLVNGSNDNSGSLIMNYVNKRVFSEISKNELVVTSGMKSLYPPGLFIGRVKNIVSREYDTSLELEMTPIIDLNRLEYVFIMLDSANE